ncbi:hypothetical protein HWV62_32142 [Athelia sp. TMB]|nr:hypothetical protein HWV62_32142 [Athelia sp. TMB]
MWSPVNCRASTKIEHWSNFRGNGGATTPMIVEAGTIAAEGHEEIFFQDIDRNGQLKRLNADLIAVEGLPSLMYYESATPTARSIFHGDDEESMAFVPYPDDPAFDALEHTLQYKSFSWQDKFHDPDKTNHALTRDPVIIALNVTAISTRLTVNEIVAAHPNVSKDLDAASWLTAHKIGIRYPKVEGLSMCPIKAFGHGLEVKESAWGLGTFLTEDVKANELISEYVGELIYEPTTESRHMDRDVVKHRKRNYVFALNSTVSIDSSYAGNETRFVNHVSKPNANSSPQVWLVNGEHRIGIFAACDMKAGTEISFDYGPQFFREEQDPAVAP